MTVNLNKLKLWWVKGDYKFLVYLVVTHIYI